MSLTCSTKNCNMKISISNSKYCDFCKCTFDGCSNSLKCKIHHCQYGDCNGFVYKSPNYCMRHKCNALNCNNDLKCDLHVCKDINCLSFKISNGDYCLHHTCQQLDCVEYKLTCRHTCADKYCTILKEANSEYCIHHKCIVCEKAKYSCKEHKCVKCRYMPTNYTDMLCCYRCKCLYCQKPSIQNKKCESHIERCIQKGCFKIATQYHLQFKKYLYCKEHSRCVMCKHKPKAHGREICHRHTNHFKTYPIHFDTQIRPVYYQEKIQQFLQLIRMKSSTLSIQTQNIEYDDTILFVSKHLSNDLFMELYYHMI